MSANKEVQIIIIGGGISGLAAADTLINKHGFTNIIIIDAGSQLGGRIKPILVKFRGQNDKYIQLGAEFLHGRGNKMYKLAKKLNLLPTRAQQKSMEQMDSEWFVDSANINKIEDGIEKSFEKFMEDTEYAWEQMINGGVKTLPHSIGQLYRFAFDKLLKRSKFNPNQVVQLRALFKETQSDIEMEHACPNWTNLSFRNWALWKELPVEEELCLNEVGFSGILDHMTKRVSSATVLLNSPVTQIDWDSKNYGVTVKLGDGRNLHADHVICTIPLGYLKKHWASLFTPALPQYKQIAIKSQGFGSMEKLFLFYSHRFWPKTLKQIAFIDDEDKFSIQLFQVYRETSHHTSFHCHTSLEEWRSGLDSIFDCPPLDFKCTCILLLWPPAPSILCCK